MILLAGSAVSLLAATSLEMSLLLLVWEAWSGVLAQVMGDETMSTLKCCPEE